MPIEVGRSMGDFGEATAQAYQFTRSDQDAYAIETLTRGARAIENGAFAKEIVPIEVAVKGGTRRVDQDEHPLKVSPEKSPDAQARVPEVTAPSRRPAPRRIADGAAALVLMRRSKAEQEKLPILAEIKAHAARSR